MPDNGDSLIVAFATLDGAAIPKAHFGEAKQYEIYRITAHNATRLESVTNPKAGEGHGVGSHHHHAGGGGKGAGIGRLLAEHLVQVMVSRAFGQNIVRMREHFLPVKVDTEEVAAAIDLLQRHWGQVQSRWLQGQARKHLVLHSHH
jgi:predicted Fe-Mo cluster-binding NifX family protein